MWLVLAILSAVLAALTSILAKVGISGVDSNLVFLTHAQDGLRTISTRSWIFLILSGLATGASWLCYYRALQIGDVSKVVPVDKLSVVFTMILAFVLLHEKFTPKSILGAILITAGTLLMVL